MKHWRDTQSGVLPINIQNQNVQKLPAQNSLSCFYVNARSVANKFDELECYVTELKPDVIFITESWANKYIASAELSLNCYTMYRRDRNLDDNGEVIIGGGVLMYITNNLKHYEIDHDVNNTESLWCTIQTAHGNSVKLGVSYDSTSNTN